MKKHLNVKLDFIYFDFNPYFCIAIICCNALEDVK